MKKLYAIALLTVLTCNKVHAGNNFSQFCRWCGESFSETRWRHDEEFKHALQHGTIDELKKAYRTICSDSGMSRRERFRLYIIASWIREARPLLNEREKLLFLAQDQVIAEKFTYDEDGRTLLDLAATLGS